MAKKRKKRKKQELEKLRYDIEVEDWEADYHVGINTMPQDLIRGAYWENPKLTLTGKILSPVLEKASKTKIDIVADPQMDDHWKDKPTIISAKAIGWMEIPRGDDTLIFRFSIPSRSLPYVTLAVDSGKIKYVTIYGTKLKWRKGTISSVWLSNELEED